MTRRLLPLFLLTLAACTPATQDVQAGDLFDLSGASDITLTTTTQRLRLTPADLEGTAVFAVPLVSGDGEASTIDVESSTGLRLRLVVMTSGSAASAGTDLLQLADALVEALRTLAAEVPEPDRAAVLPFIDTAAQAVVELRGQVDSARSGPALVGSANEQVLFDLAALRQGDSLARGVLAGVQPFSKKQQGLAGPFVLIALGVVAVAYLANLAVSSADEVAAKFDKAKADGRMLAEEAKVKAANAAKAVNSVLNRVVNAVVNGTRKLPRPPTMPNLPLLWSSPTTRPVRGCTAQNCPGVCCANACFLPGATCP